MRKQVWTVRFGLWASPVTVLADSIIDAADQGEAYAREYFNQHKNLVGAPTEPLPVQSLEFVATVWERQP